MNKEEQGIRAQELQKMYQDNLSIWEGNEFLELQNRYQQAKKDYLKLIDNAKARSMKTIITKGQIISAFPFEVEQYGAKRNGKTIPEIIVHNDCYIHHFDDQNRLILKENMSVFLAKPSYFSLYYYTDSTIEYIYGSSEIYRYQIFYLSEKGQFIGNKVCAKHGNSFENYYYKKDLIVRSENHQIELGKKPQLELLYEYDYLYTEQGVIKQILCHYPFGGRETKYSTHKINFKKLEQKIFEEMKAILKQFLTEHKDEKITRFGIDCNAPNYMFLCLDDSINEELLESLADWQYTEVGEIDLVDFPLDDKQNEKLILTIAKALVSLVSSPEFKSLFETPNFKIVFLDHQGSPKKDYSSVKKILKDDMYY